MFDFGTALRLDDVLTLALPGFRFRIDQESSIEMRVPRFYRLFMTSLITLSLSDELTPSNETTGTSIRLSSVSIHFVPSLNYRVFRPVVGTALMTFTLVT